MIATSITLKFTNWHVSEIYNYYSIISLNANIRTTITTSNDDISIKQSMGLIKVLDAYRTTIEPY